MSNATASAADTVKKISLLRILGPGHVWALGVGIVLVGEYTGWNFAADKGGTLAALIICWVIGLLYTSVAMIDSEVTRLLNESYKRAFSLLKAHRRELDLLAEALLNYETLDADDIHAIIEGDPKTVDAKMASSHRLLVVGKSRSVPSSAAKVAGKPEILGIQ